jgi:tetratricopeptide (TPR) repeat protein
MRSVGALVAVLMVALRPCAARADAAEGAPPARVQRAELHAELAFEAYEDNQYERALALYEMALAAADSADILFNIARVYDRGLGDRVRALEYIGAISRTRV